MWWSSLDSRTVTMAYSSPVWTALVFPLLMICATGVFSRAIDSREFGDGLHISELRTWRREVTEGEAERCTAQTPWTESSAPPPAELAPLLRLRVRPLSAGDPRSGVFPGKSLFSFIRRVYRCCREGLHCRNVRGLQGHLVGGADVEFLLTRDVLSASVTAAEFHLQLLNPQGLDIKPVLLSMAKRNLPTRYSLWSRGDRAELRLDLLFLFRGLREAADGAGGGLSLVNIRQAGVLPRGGPRERPAQQSLQHTKGDLWGDGFSRSLGLVLSCTKGGSGVSCEQNGVHVLHAPFIALSYG